MGVVGRLPAKPRASARGSRACRPEFPDGLNKLLSCAPVSPTLRSNDLTFQFLQFGMVLVAFAASGFQVEH
jgi:hypothetical protein